MDTGCGALRRVVGEGRVLGAVAEAPVVLHEVDLHALRQTPLVVRAEPHLRKE